MVLTLEEKIVGFTSVESLTDKSCWITYLFIDPTYQRKDLAKHLATAIIMHANEVPYDQILARTSSLQVPQHKFLRKFIDSLNSNKPKGKLELRNRKEHWWMLIYPVDIIITRIATE